ncbi:26S proteasome subunit RPN7-domain-containing protein [Geopyxis carbonaria]|nr:26S proteasome subunit RPN7-domain-containing protein [Geopyxis carbonaria]
MASSTFAGGVADSVRAYFEQQQQTNNAVVVHGAPRFDLEAYIANYTGRTQVDRLLLIGTHSPPLAVEALKLAIKSLKNSQDVQRYRFAVAILQKMAPDDPDAVLDEEWAEKTARKNASEAEKIENTLKSYKHNLIKESIRMGHEDLGNHYYACGELTNAVKSYSRMRDFCTAPKHILDMSLQIIRVSIEQGNYMSVQAHIAKIRNLQRTPEEEEQLKPKLNTAMALAHMSLGAYRDAARAFLDCPPTLGASFNEVLSSNDVAVYGGLCALASMDRQALKTEVLDNTNFRQFLELEPHMRRAISFFFTAKYASCLQILDEYKADYMLDVHLARHVRALYDTIRAKGIVQYFIPYSCVTLSGMAAAFSTPEAQLEAELIRMIEARTLDARVDTKNRLLTAKEADLRETVHRETLAMAQAYERQARMKLVRMNMIRAGLEVRGSKMQGGDMRAHGGGGRGGGGGGGLALAAFVERFT